MHQVRDSASEKLCHWVKVTQSPGQEEWPTNGSHGLHTTANTSLGTARSHSQGVPYSEQFHLSFRVFSASSRIASISVLGCLFRISSSSCRSSQGVLLLCTYFSFSNLLVTMYQYYNVTKSLQCCDL